MLTTRTIVRRSVALSGRVTGCVARRPLTTITTRTTKTVNTCHNDHRGVQGLQRFISTSKQVLQSPEPRITEATADVNTKMLRVTWGDGSEDKFPFVWMRDNCVCPSCLHPTAKNRQLSVTTLRSDMCPAFIQVSKEGKEVEVRWPDDHVSHFSSSWLQSRAFKTHHLEKQLESFRLKMELWGGEKQGRIRRFSFPRLQSDDKTLLAFLEVVEVEGVAIVTDMPRQEDMFKVFTKEKIGYVRPTHYGETFSVRSKAGPSNVAYTQGALDVHNDMVYLEEKPGIQIMHCLSQTKGQGGDHILVDSFHVANQMRDKHPALFRRLTDTVITFVDVGCDSIGPFHALARHPTIVCDEAGVVTGTNISNHSRDSLFPGSPEDAVRWYEALLAFTDMLNDPNNYITNKLQDGEMVVLDNHRVLHGRLAYQESEGERHIVSGYWDWDEVRSRRRVLQASVSGVC